MTRPQVFASLGLLVGLVLKFAGVDPSTAKLVGYPGRLFIRGLTVVVLPYIASSMFVSQKSDGPATGMGAMAIGFYTCTVRAARGRLSCRSVLHSEFGLRGGFLCGRDGR